MTLIYLDLECSDLRGTTLIQIASITQDNKIFNAFCQTERPLPLTCTQLTGFYVYQRRLFQHGFEVETLPERKVLSLFANWILANSNNTTFILAHNGFGYDFRVLLKHYSDYKIQFPEKVIFCDTLPVFKKLYKLPSSSLASLAAHFKIKNKTAHNALSDAIVLKQVCDIANNDKKESNLFTQKRKKVIDFAK